MHRAVNTSLQLKNGAEAGIVGGEPARSFFAPHLLRYSRRIGLDLHVAIFEARNFNQAGPLGCTRCAGLLSNRGSAIV